MICKTNHALDQFLKHISKFEDRIVRIGSRSQEPSLQKYLLRSIKDEYKQTKQKFHTPSLRFLKEQIEIVEELYKKITKEIEDYVLNDKDYEIYQDFTINLKELVMDSFEKFGNFDFNQKKRQVEYFELKDEIIRQWWQCKIDTKYLEKFSILTENQFKQIQIRSKEWNQKMKQEKKEYLDKLNNQRYIDIQELERQKLLEEYKLRNPLAQQEDLQKIQQEQKENEEESDDEENYFENKNEYDLEDNIKIPHFEKQAEDSYLLKVKCDENEFEELIKKLERGTLNLFKLNYSQVRNLKAYAVQYIQEDTLSKMKKSLQLYYQYQQQFKEELNQDDARILIEMKTKIIGMTLNGASINSHLLKYLKSPIIIIEEAGEVLESLLIPVLQSSTQQLILIGDHQQLKPSVNNYDLEKKYNFNTSLLERLVNNNIEFAQLNVQRRMNPEFADYIRLIYKDYQDHNDLKKVQNVRGMPSNMYLISHKQNEENIENSTSKRNIFEAKYAIKLAQYIIMQQQFNEEQITILSMYLGQCQLIRKLAKQEKMFKIKISSVDNYQGEENEIIILSLVRSNQAKKLGYTKTENRINVSFSRAKKGFYCIGNFEMIKQVQEAKLWHQIIDLAKKKQHLVESIYFKCNKHADVTKVTHFNDFDQMPKGGCKKVCNTMKGCGHSCSQTCHLDECENYKCNKPCIRQINQCSHYCQMKCYEKCKCTQQINKILNCGHQKLCLCSNDITQERCEAKVQINLICGHQKEVKCCEQQFKNHQCQKLVNMKLRCGHLKEVKCCNQAKPHECKIEVEFCCPDCKKSMLKKKCFQRETNDQCTALVNKQLKCYHFKSIPCNMKPESAKCEQEVLKQLQCGHKKKLKCFEDPSEEKNCQELVLKQLKCSHYQELKCCESIDKAKCQQQIQTQLRCGHFIEAKCSESVEQAICNQLINLRLKCGHFACNIPCKEKEDSQYKCNQLLTIQLECGHFSSHFCYEKDIPRQCIETYQNKKKCCGLTYTISCPEYQRQQYNIPECSCSNQFIICPHNINGLERQNLCDQICGIILDCGHKCQSTCSQCAFGVLHKPCKQEVIIEYNCGHKIKKECSQDPNFCSEPCQIQECLHQMKKQKKCSKTCLEKCSLQITKSKCNQCENSEWNELGCGHSFNNLDEIISQQYQKNPFRSPECLICQQPINILKYKIILKDVKINQYFFSKGIKNKVKQIISDFSISDQQFQEISKEYIVFEKSAQLFDKFRMCYLYQSIKYLKELQKHYISIDNQDQETQKILNTIKLQVKILEQTYLKENQKNLGINQIRKFVNTIIFLTGMFYQFMEYNTKSLQLKQFNVYQMPSEPDYNSVVYQVFQYNQAFQLHMITNNLWQSPILAPTQTQITILFQLIQTLLMYFQKVNMSKQPYQLIRGYQMQNISMQLKYIQEIILSSHTIMKINQ